MFPQQNLLIKNPDIFVTSKEQFSLFDDCLNSIVSILPGEQQHQTLKVIQIVWPHIARSSLQNEGRMIMEYKVEISFSLMDSFHCISLLIV